jgi:Galactose oxidase, central domain
MKSKKTFRALLGGGVLLLGFALVGQAAAQTWTQLFPTADPTYGSPSPRVYNSTVYNTANKRLIVFGGGGPGGYGPLNDVWVLTNADGTGGSPNWIKLIPSGGPPAAREMHAAVYDQANNRMIIHAGYTMPGYCEGVIGDVWVLSNADGTGGAPTWTQLFPAGTTPFRRTHGAAYDSINNRLMINGGPPAGCGPGVNDTWVLTNANGLGGTPAWTQLAPTAPADFPSDMSDGNSGYDSATNTLIRFLPVRDVSQTTWSLSTWLLSNANGLGGSPAWSKLAVSPELAIANWGGGVYDEGTNKFAIFGAGSAVSPTNETWTLANANGVGTPAWTQLSPAGTLPDPRVASFASYAPGTNRLTIYGGSKNNWDGTDEVWVLTDVLYPTEITVAIDIKPGSDPNSINPKSNGKIPVAILSSASFDAVAEVAVNVGTLTFGHGGDEMSLAFCNAKGEKVNKDSLPDLVCHFHTPVAGFQAGDTQGFLKGETISGRLFQGADTIRTVPK